MKRSTLTITLAAVLALALTIPALAASPTVSKTVLGESVDGTTVLVISVKATDHTIFGVDILDASGSVTDVIAPKGWVGITDGGDVQFRTGEKPISAGNSLSFRVVTTNRNATLKVSFKDAKTTVGESKTL